MFFCFLPPTRKEVYAIARDVCLSVCVQDYSKTRAWIWMKFCVSTGRTDQLLSPIRIIVRMPEPENLKSKVGQTGPHTEQATGHGVHYREVYCLLHVVVQGPGSFRGQLNFSVQRTVAEPRGVKLAQFSDFGLCLRYMRSTDCPSSFFSIKHALVTSNILKEIH